MTTIHYPVKGRKFEQMVTQQTLDMLVAQMADWQQGPGVFGRLNLHSCWGTASVLDRGYQGETITIHSRLMRPVRTLYEKTGNPKWRVLENTMAAHLLYLQEADGGFVHGSAEFEPTFSTRSGVIHCFHPVLALCEYYQWPHADENIKALIPDAIDRQWAWTVKNLWRAGNSGPGKRPLPHPGWSGVTNQDLVAVGAIARSVALFGHDERYTEYAAPALDYLLSDANYYEDIGLFERGDGVNFAERTTYYTHILDMLELLYDLRGEQRLRDAYDNVCAHLFDAVFVGEDGLTYLARGAKTDPVDKSRVLGWDLDGAIAFGAYPDLIGHMEKFTARHPSALRRDIIASLKDTIAAYVFVDGSLPLGLRNKNPLFHVAGNLDDSQWIEMVIRTLGDRLVDPRPVELPALWRQNRNLTWKQKSRIWAIEDDGVRKYGGYTRYPAGIVQGPDAALIYGSFDELERPDYIEIVD